MDDWPNYYDYFYSGPLSIHKEIYSHPGPYLSVRLKLFLCLYKFLVDALEGPIERRKFLQAIMKWGLNTNNEWCGWLPLRVAHYCVSNETLAPILPHLTVLNKHTTWSTATNTKRPKTLEEVTANIHIPQPPPPPPMVDLCKKDQRQKKLCLSNRRRLELIKNRIKMANKKCTFGN